MEKLSSLNQLQGLCLITTKFVKVDKPFDHESFVLRTNETEFSGYDQCLETHVGQVHMMDDAQKFLKGDNRIDFDEFRQVFVLVCNGQMVDDNIYLDNLAD
ncbi:iron-sulfur cluster biosynthesis family protein [Aerococcus urinaehominis]|nr:iron-sulfur cluster biosynthesis family protein [Aerococcus urinaehominis]